MTNIHIVARSLASIPAPKLGALSIEESLKRANVEKEAVTLLLCWLQRKYKQVFCYQTGGGTCHQIWAE